MSREPSNQLDRTSWLTSRYLAGDATAEELEELNTCLSQRPSLAESFVRDTFIEARLAARLRVPLHLASSRPTDKGSRSVSIARWLAAAASVALLIVGFASWGMTRPFTENPRARLLGVLDASWAGESLHIGSEVPTGPLRLEAGLARLRLASGSEGIIEGPAEFVVVGDQEISLTSGKAVFACPTPSSRGLVVRTPTAVMVDVGTEFGVSADARATLTHVFDGAVEIAAVGGSPALVRAGQTRRVDAHLLRVDEAELTSHFTRPARWRELEKRQSLPFAVATWRGRLLADPSLLVWCDLEEGWHGGATANLADEAAAELRSAAGSAELKAVIGRAEGEKAATFERHEDRIEVVVPGTYPALTLAAWVRLAPFDSDDTSQRGLLMADGWGKRGQVHWQVKGRDFRASFFAEGDKDDGRYPASPENLLDGHWHLLTTVIDTRARAVSHYADGRLVVRREITGAAPPLSIGRASIGGWTPDPARSGEDRALRGAIDELFVWGRALTEEEIAQTYIHTAPP